MRRVLLGVLVTAFSFTGGAVHAGVATDRVVASSVVSSEAPEPSGEEARAAWLAGALVVFVATAGGGVVAVWRRWRGSRGAAP
ncbi:hypothetical protein ACIBEJ_17350 [Nonomuraea sp. NPDC050790]|uniref:hypothetical protein n=1 Tax=Nonomuraea sp. NPDC050790 TaxID=3364371 RepID=UPI0037A83AEB